MTPRIAAIATVAAAAAVAVAVAALAAAPVASAYSWPLKPFHRAHPIRGAFGDPRYHVGVNGELASFHFGVDIAARDGTPVYAVEPGYVHAYGASVTVTTHTSREFGYWHIRPVVKTGAWARLHQLLGYIRPGWGHVHFAESFGGQYKDPLRRGALTPFFDRTPPVVDSITLVSPTGQTVDPHHVSGVVGVVASAYDLPPLAPPGPWSVARLAPASIWWTLSGNGVDESASVADFGAGILPNALYGLVYAPGTYQNKPNRPGKYLFWGARSLDTTQLADGTYELTVSAEDTRANIGTLTIQLQVANGLGTS
jgi:murein DD-endopeptidase MepM/ murein hydrolase activator NlpD